MTSLKQDLEAAIESVEDSVFHAAEEMKVRAHLHPWHPISTAPNNSDLELEVVSDGRCHTLAFPCRRLNNDEWLNSDLGVRVEMVPVRWRIWSFRKPIVEHVAPAPADDHSALIHTHGIITSKNNEPDT
jgi:hypothetical protein